MQTPHPKARNSQQSDPLGPSGVVSGSDELSEPQCCPDRADQTGARESRASRERSPEVNLRRPVRARRSEAAGRSERRTLPRRKEISRGAERAEPGGVRCAAPGPL